MKDKVVKVQPEELEKRAKYKPIFVQQVFKLSLLGATDQEIADFFCVHVSVVAYWKENKTGFLASMRKGKEKADSKVAHALYKSAIGFQYKDVTVLTNRKKTRNDKGTVIEEHTEPLIVEIEKTSLPNVTAAKTWLERRQPDKWGAKVEIGGTINHEHKIDMSGLTLDELKVMNKLGVASTGYKTAEDIDFEEIIENE